MTPPQLSMVGQRSNLGKADEQRDYRIFEDYAEFMVEQARKPTEVSRDFY